MTYCPKSGGPEAPIPVLQLVLGLASLVFLVAMIGGGMWVVNEKIGRILFRMLGGS